MFQKLCAFSAVDKAPTLDVLVLFIVGAFSFQGKMPNYNSDLFFLQTTDLTLIGPLFRESLETP